MIYKDKQNYRVYALIIGQIISEGIFFGCEIKKMNFKEQKRRKFSAFQFEFSELCGGENYKTYITSLPYVDPVKIKSKYVIICDIKGNDPKSALGGAIKKIDKFCRFFSIAYVEDAKKGLNKERVPFLPYIYQINKIYFLDAAGGEANVDLKLESNHVFLPNRPESNMWHDEKTQEFLNELFNFHDDILERAAKYLYRSSIGAFILDSPEKIALDHFKSIEIIVNSLSKKKKFKDRLQDAAIKIGIEDDECKKINEMWNDRSNGDVAHPSAYDEAERYPNQFPMVSNVKYSGASSSIAINVLLKYFDYRKSIFYIEIDEPFFFTNELGERCSTENNLSLINVQWESNHLCFSTSEKNKRNLVRKIKNAFAKEYKMKETDILFAKLGQGKKSVVLRIKKD